MYVIEQIIVNSLAKIQTHTEFEYDVMYCATYFFWHFLK